MTDYHFCVEFTVPQDVDLQEQRNLAMSPDHRGNPTMSALRVVLQMDGRWRLDHVSSNRPEVDRSRQHLLVWVTASAPSIDEARRVVQAGVHDVVSGVITAEFYAITDEP